MKKTQRFLKQTLLAGALLAASLSVAPSRGQDPDPSPLSPEMLKCVQDLTATDQAVQQKAVAQLQILLGSQWAAIIGGADDETLPRLGRLASFQEGVATWLLSAKKYSAKDARGMIQFGREHLPVVAMLYCSDLNRRVDAIHELGAIPGPEAETLLASVLNDDNRQVSVAAMESIWDRPPAAETTDVLWDRAVGHYLTGEDARASRAEVITFRSRPIAGTPIFSARGWDADADVVVQVIQHQHSPRIEEHLTKSFRALATEVTGDTHSYRHATLLTNQGIKNLFDLAQSFHAKGMMAPLISLIQTEPKSNIVNRPMPGRQVMYASSRTAPINLWITLVGEHPDTYNMRDRASMYGPYGFDTKKDEDAAVARISEWWTQHKTEYLVSGSATATTATAPATAPTAPAQ